MVWRSYGHMGRIEQLRNKGRELLGKTIYWTQKRDGANVPLYMQPDGHTIEIGSRKMEIADGNICNGARSSTNWVNVCKVMREFPDCTIYWELMSPGRGPTRIEMPRKYHSMILIDIYDPKTDSYIHYNGLHQIAHKFKVPLVKLHSCKVYTELKELYKNLEVMIKWSRQHHCEGFVGKVYDVDNQIFFKEKIDLPKLSKRNTNKSVMPKYPQMPESTIQSAITQAELEVTRNGGDFTQPKDAMPVVAKYIQTEAREHNYNAPNGLFIIWKEFIRYKIAQLGVIY